MSLRTGGTVLTKPLLLHAAARTLLLNLDTGVGGEVRVAICDGGEAAYSPAQGSDATSLRCAKELPGLGLAASVPLTRNSLSAAVTWAGGSLESAAESGKPIRLLFTMEDAWLFSFRFE